MFDHILEFMLEGFRLLLFLCLFPLFAVLFLVRLFTGNEIALLDRMADLLP